MNAKGVFEWEVGGWFNCLQDGCEEYIPTLEEALDIVYQGAMNDYARQGMYAYGRAPKEMRFAGSKFVKEVIADLFMTDGDVQDLQAEGYLL